jgi:ferredoxin
MSHLTIDGRQIDVPPGATILDAAERLGIEIPTLCFLKGWDPSTSCLVCMVKIRNRNGAVPACATVAVEGMEVESETAEVHAIRKTALELLLSDHLGDCFAPCQFACPAHMDIPLMLRQIAGDDARQAIATVKQRIALPAVLGRVCPKPCEKGCRRAAADGPAAICQLKRYVADRDLASGAPFLPPCQPASGMRVAIVGAGPTGLSAAYYLAQQGHAVTLFDEQPQPGGRLLRETTPEQLPRDVLRSEIDTIVKLGVELRLGCPVGHKPSLDELRQQDDAVLIACGAIDKTKAAMLGLPVGPHGLVVDRESFQTACKGVFAAGSAIRVKGLVVRSVADGYEVAVAIGRHLASQPFAPAKKAFASRIGRIEPRELDQFLAVAGSAPRREPEGEFTVEQAAEQAGRCLRCDCRALASCKLKHYAEQYGADPGRFRTGRREFQQVLQHAHSASHKPGDVPPDSEAIFEPGKCIACGLCIQIATVAGEPLGLTFVGRGFDVRVGVPFNRSLDDALSLVAAQVVAACPTGALAFRLGTRSQLPILGQR